MSVAVCRWGDVPLPVLGRRVEAAADLLRCPASSQSPLLVTVTLALECQNSARTLNDLVVEDVAEPSYWYFRLGKVPTPDDDIRSKLSYRVLKRLEKPVQIGYIWGLAGWFDEDDGRLRLSRVHASEFGDFCIGDCSSWTPWNNVRVSHRADFLPPYLHISWKGLRKADLDRRIRVRVDSRCPEPGSGAPLLAPYCFNYYRADDRGLGVAAWPKEGIEVAVRCVNHCSTIPGCRNVVFPADVRLEIEESDTVDSIKACICREINRSGHEDGRLISSSELFEVRCDARRGMERWVMAQVPGPQKLFRYTEGRLTQYLSSSLKVRSKDKRLFMEHIVPRVSWSLTSRSLQAAVFRLRFDKLGV